MSPRDGYFRNRVSLNLIQELRVLKDKGYSAVQAAEASTCGTKSYRFRIFSLLEHGNPDLIEDVEQGRIPLTVAIHVARAKSNDLRKILADGYKTGTVSGRQINEIRQIVDHYEKEEKFVPQASARISTQTTAADSLIRHFRNESDKQKLVVKKAMVARSHLTFITAALRRLFSEQAFIELLRAEGVQTMPSWLAERIRKAR